MKKIIFALLTVSAALGAGYFFSHNAVAQQGGEAAPSAQHKIALIDMAELFKKYQKFQDKREGLKGQIENKEKVLKATIKKMADIQEEMKTFSQGSDEFIAREKQLTKMKSEIESERQSAQRDFFRQESKVYKEVYDEVTAAVASYAKYYKYTLVLRFSREDTSGNEDPQKVMQDLQRQVVYYQKGDDITDKVLQYLNKQYKENGGNISPVSNREEEGRPAATAKPKVRSAAKTDE